jgi:hypothetical protein
VKLLRLLAYEATGGGAVTRASLVATGGRGVTRASVVGGALRELSVGTVAALSIEPR